MITNPQSGTNVHEIADGKRLAKVVPPTPACMHGSAWRGDCAGRLRGSAKTVAGRRSTVA